MGGTMDYSHCFGLKYNNFLLFPPPKKFLSFLPKYYQDVSRLSTQINESSLAWKKRFHGQALARSICKFLCAQSRCLQKPFKKRFQKKQVFFWPGYYVVITVHSSEIRCLCMMKLPSEMVQNLPYFWIW